MKRRKRMGIYKAPTTSRDSIGTTGAPHAHDVAEMRSEQAREPVPSAIEPTPEKFVAFVNRMAEARSP